MPKMFVCNFDFGQKYFEEFNTACTCIVCNIIESYKLDLAAKQRVLVRKYIETRR